MAKIWIKRIDEFIDKTEDEKTKSYLVWVKRIQGNMYRIYKLNEKGTVLWKLAKLCLAKNYELLYANNLEKHLQHVWYIIEKLNKIAKDINDEDLSKTVEMLFGMTVNTAKTVDYQLIKREGND